MKSMFLFIEKIKNNAKKVALLSILFLSIFYAIFSLVNLDIAPVEKMPIQNDQTLAVDTGAEIKKRMGSTTFSMESYDEWAKRFNLDTSKGIDLDPDGDGLPNYLEYIHGTNPLKADTDGDKFSDRQEIINGYDPDAPGDTKPQVEISIEKIAISTPMVFSKTEIENDMLKDLENGLSHFAKTAAPGQSGNMVISGHSSNYIWKKGNYNHIFKDLNNLEQGDLVKVRTTQKNGRIVTYTYQVTEKFIATPDDERIFANTENPTMTLSTCWPIGTNLKRVIVKTELVK